MTHTPVPLHEPPGWNTWSVPPTQKNPLHWVLAATRVQAPPVQVPVLPQLPFGPQRLCLSVSPSGWSQQVPRWPRTSQAWQVVLQELLKQQKPSTQLPDWHSWPSPQAVPFGFLPVQIPGEPALPVQYMLVVSEHWLSAVQLTRQLLPLQT
jgi:hypothetical protein